MHGSSRPGRTQDICLDGFLSFYIALQILLHKLTRHFPTFGNTELAVKRGFILFCACVESTVFSVGSEAGLKFDEFHQLLHIHVLLCVK